ncbi:MAG TPA: hypothetical protein PK040_00445 [Anaerolineaceae bacterium]|nr:hypothetical protein [Anaerolineaceae bacterium]
MREIWIDQLIQLGKQEAEEELRDRKEKEEIEYRDWRNDWENCHQEFISYLPVTLRPYIEFPDDFIDHRPAPEHTFEIKWPLKIVGLAPILVQIKFPTNTSLQVGYHVPRIEFFDENDEFVFFYSSRGYGYQGSLCMETLSLERALFDASEKYKKLTSLNEELNLKKEIKANPLEPTYENLDGSEPLPYLVLIENLRRLIREEIKQTN